MVLGLALSINMSPYAAGFNVTDSHFSNAKHFCDFHILNDPFAQKSPYFSYILFGQFCSMVVAATRATRAKNCKRMKNIVGFRHIFDILDARIALISIFVVDHNSGQLWSNEGPGNEPMNADAPLFPIPPKLHMWIAFVINQPGQNLASIRSTSAPATVFNHTLDTPKVRNIIDTFIARNWPPLFDHFEPRVDASHCTRFAREIS